MACIAKMATPATMGARSMVMLIAARRLLVGDADGVVWDDKDALTIGDVSQFVER